MVHSTRRILLLVLLAALLTPAAAAAQITTFERQLLPIQKSALAKVPEDFWAALKFMREEEERQRSLKGAVKFAFRGDESGDQSLFKLSTGIELSRGVYPAELLVASELGLQLKDGELQEEVTTLRISYDYHTKTWLEYFGFAQRFSDSFLSIEQRYEIGFGARFGVYLGRTAGDYETTRRHFDAFDRSFDESPVTPQYKPPAKPQATTGEPDAVISQIATAARNKVPGAPSLSEQDVENLKETVNYLNDSFIDRESRVFLGIAISLMTDLERAELEVLTKPAENAPAGTIEAKKKFALPSEYRYRLSLRPTFRLRPGKGLLLTVYPYFKLPLDSPRRIDVDGSQRLDYRRDVFTRLAWSLDDAQTGHENVEFAFKFDHYFDNVPPTIGPETIATELTAGRILDRTRAERSHSVVGVELAVKWGG